MVYRRRKPDVEGIKLRPSWSGSPLRCETFSLARQSVVYQPAQVRTPRLQRIGLLREILMPIVDLGDARQKGILTRIWARPSAPRDQRYDWAYLFGAVCPARAATAAIVVPHANAEAMNIHLDAISRAVAPGAHALIVMDGAGYHHRAAIKLPAIISVLKLPPYSPELNPIENVWQYLR